MSLDVATVTRDLRSQVAPLRHAVPAQVQAVAIRVDEADVILAGLERAEALEQEVERLHSWTGLLSILDEHYPTAVFEASPDPGARIVTLTRHLGEARARAERLEAALREIASCEVHVQGDVVDVARKALEPGQ